MPDKYKQWTEEEHLTLRERILRIEHAITGNGAKGLKDQIKEIDNSMSVLKRIVRDLNRNMYIAMGGAAVLMFVLEKLVSFIKMP